MFNCFATSTAKCLGLRKLPMLGCLVAWLLGCLVAWLLGCLMLQPSLLMLCYRLLWCLMDNWLIYRLKKHDVTDRQTDRRTDGWTLAFLELLSQLKMKIILTSPLVKCCKSIAMLLILFLLSALHFARCCVMLR